MAGGGLSSSSRTVSYSMRSSVSTDSTPIARWVAVTGVRIPPNATICAEHRDDVGHAAHHGRARHAPADAQPALGVEVLERLETRGSHQLHGEAVVSLEGAAADDGHRRVVGGTVDIGVEVGGVLRLFELTAREHPWPDGRIDRPANRPVVAAQHIAESGEGDPDQHAVRRSREHLDRAGDALRAQLETSHRPPRPVLADGTARRQSHGCSGRGSPMPRAAWVRRVVPVVAGGAGDWAVTMTLTPTTSASMRARAADQDAHCAPPAQRTAASSTASSPAAIEATERRTGSSGTTPRPSMRSPVTVTKSAIAYSSTSPFGSLRKSAGSAPPGVRAPNTRARPAACIPPAKTSDALYDVLVHEDGDTPRIRPHPDAIGRHQAGIGYQTQFGIAHAQRTQVARRVEEMPRHAHQHRQDASRILPQVDHDTGRVAGRIDRAIDRWGERRHPDVEMDVAHPGAPRGGQHSLIEVRGKHGQVPELHWLTLLRRARERQRHGTSGRIAEVDRHRRAGRTAQQADR